MNYSKALIIKFVMITAVLWFFLDVFFGNSFTDILITSIVLTVLSFIIGDVLILSNAGNMTATIADMGLAFLCIWGLDFFLFEEPISLEVVSLLAVVITIGEFFFHGYMKKIILKGFSEKEKSNTDLFAEK